MPVLRARHGGRDRAVRARESAGSTARRASRATSATRARQGAASGGQSSPSRSAGATSSSTSAEAPRAEPPPDPPLESAGDRPRRLRDRPAPAALVRDHHRQRGAHRRRCSGPASPRWLGEDPEDGWSMLLLVMVFGIIGARIYHVIHLWELLQRQPDRDPADLERRDRHPRRDWRAARSASSSATRSKGINTARWLDIFAPAAAARPGDRPARQLRQPGALRPADLAVRHRGTRPACRSASRSTPRTAPARPWDRRPSRSRRTTLRSALRVRDGAQPDRHARPPLRHPPIRPAPLRRRRGAHVPHVVRRRAHPARDVSGQQLDDPRASRPRCGSASSASCWPAPGSSIGTAADGARR